MPGIHDYHEAEKRFSGARASLCKEVKPEAQWLVNEKNKKKEKADLQQEKMQDSFDSVTSSIDVVTEKKIVPLRRLMRSCLENIQIVKELSV